MGRFPISIEFSRFRENVVNIVRKEDKDEEREREREREMKTLITRITVKMWKISRKKYLNHVLKHSFFNPKTDKKTLFTSKQTIEEREGNGSKKKRKGGGGEMDKKC